MRTDGEWFKDEEGRTLLLRGVNLGGSSKVPVRPDGSTWKKAGFYDYRDVSFAGRPFQLEEADEHFRRLKEWGLTFERFIVTWEAIEHAGPGLYDEEYLDYVRAVLEKAAGYGINVFIDPHQDVWSRWTGGDGAPAWTLEMLGINIRNMHETGAAFIHCEYGDPIPHMIWGTNNYKLGACTMFTLFYGGDDFAPHCMADGVAVQEFLQGRFINAVKKLAVKLKGLPNIAGYGTLNEPQGGYIGFRDLSGVSEYLFLGEAGPSPLQSMAAADGRPVEVDRYRLRITGSKKIGKTVINPEGKRLWKDGAPCIWKEHGVWNDEGGTPRILKPGYFSFVNGRKVNFANDYLKPFVKRFAREIHSVSSDAVIFMEAVPGMDFPVMSAEEVSGQANTSHWYDILTVYRNKYNPWFTGDVYKRKLVIGRRNAARAMVDQIAHIKSFSRENLHGAPTLIGEFGLMFKLNKGRAYRTGDYSSHIKALDAYYNAMDANLVCSTIWNYTSDNSNLRGDNWNNEDNSIFSRDQQDNPADINSGGRAIEGYCRPYAARTAGVPLSMSFDKKQRRFVYSFRPDDGVKAPTEIFVPRCRYPNGYTVTLSNGTYEKDEKGQTLCIMNAKGDKVTIAVSPL